MMRKINIKERIVSSKSNALCFEKKSKILGFVVDNTSSDVIRIYDIYKHYYLNAFFDLKFY